jgi:hypothetical protein
MQQDIEPVAVNQYKPLHLAKYRQIVTGAVDRRLD